MSVQVSVQVVCVSTGSVRTGSVSVHVVSVQVVCVSTGSVRTGSVCVSV